MVDLEALRGDTAYPKVEDTTVLKLSDMTVPNIADMAKDLQVDTVTEAMQENATSGQPNLPLIPNLTDLDMVDTEALQVVDSGVPKLL